MMIVTNINFYVHAKVVFWFLFVIVIVQHGKTNKQTYLFPTLNYGVLETDYQNLYFGSTI